MQDKIDKIVEYDMDFSEEFAKKVLDIAQSKANCRKENAYICGDINCLYVVCESELTNEDIITSVEPE